jgi:alpha-galactosidase
VPLLGLLGGGVEGAQHRPALAGSPVWMPSWEQVDVSTSEGALRSAYRADGLLLTSTVALDEHGVLRLTHELANEGGEVLRLDRLDVALPVPHRAVELLDQTGRWCRERHPQRVPWTAQGTWLREGRHGRTGHDAPVLLVAGTPAFTDRTGEVWGLHLGWSGDIRYYAERRPDGRAVVGAGEALHPGELVLDPGAVYRTPDVLAVWSPEGLDGLSRRLHRHVRSRPQHPRRPRPATINTWEAVYFDHDLDRLRSLADAAAEVGLERFVLDDGWFRGRRHDRAGLGDWEVDPQVWPDGLHPLVEHLHGLGMELGLWVEPEMVNEDSDLFRAHPDWVLRPGAGLPPRWRHQQVLDLANPAAFDHLLARLDALLSEYPIAYLKWDHNRDLVGAAHDGRPAVHGQTRAFYALLDELRARHPGLEIESCASGGGRVDLGVLARAERVWASDCNDALERQTIQRWTQLVLPPELVGSHVGPPRSHTTGRTHALSFRGATALFGHFGVEWDVSALGADERAALARLVTTYKTHRDLLHTGEVVHADPQDPALLVHGVVAPDRSAAVFACVTLASSAAETWPPARLPGLDLEASYRIERLDTGGEPFVVQQEPPGWWPEAAATAVLPGAFLGEVGLALPVLAPEQALVLHLVRVDAG